MNGLDEAAEAGGDSLMAAGPDMRRRLFDNMHNEVAHSFHAPGNLLSKRGDEAVAAVFPGNAWPSARAR